MFASSQSFQPPNFNGAPPIIAEVIRGCCDIDPDNRPTAEDIAERLVRWKFRKAHDGRDHNGDTELMLAVRSGQKHAVSDLLYDAKYWRKPLMVNTINNAGHSAFDIAKREHIKKLLLGYREIPPSNTEPSKDIHYTHNIDVASVLSKAIEAQDTFSIDFLLRTAPQSCHEDLKKAMYKGQTPLHWAACIKDATTIKSILRFSLFDVNKPDHRGETALIEAARYGHSAVIESLLVTVKSNNIIAPNVGVCVNFQNRAGQSALHCAVEAGSFRAVRLLVSFPGIDINICDKLGRPPTFGIISNEVEIATSIMSYFLDQSCFNLNIQDKSGETVLHNLARANLAPILRLLLQRSDLNPNLLEKVNCWSPLHLAAFERSEDAIRELLQRKDLLLNCVDRNGNNILHTLSVRYIELRDTSSHVVLKHDHDTTDLDLISLILSRDTSMLKTRNNYNHLPIHEASLEGRVNILAHLMSAVQQLESDTIAEHVNEGLILAANKGHLKAVDFLLAQDSADANYVGPSGCTALQKAAENGYTSIVERLLLLPDIDIDASCAKRGAEYDPSLHRSSDRILDTVIDDMAGSRSLTPLHRAACNGYATTVKLLLQNGASVDISNNYSYTAFHDAAENGYSDVMEELLSHPDVANQMCSDKNVSRLLERAAANGHLNVVKMLLERGIDVNVGEALNKSAHSGHIEVTEYLLSQRDISQFHLIGCVSPLLPAAAEGHVHIVKLLLQRGENVNATRSGATALHYSAERDHVKVVEELLSHPEIELDDMSYKTYGTDELCLESSILGTCLRNASKNGHLDVVTMLLQQGAKVNEVDEYELTALHWAAEHGHIDVVEALLKRPEIDVHVRSSMYGTPLDVASNNEHVNVVEMLLQHGINVNEAGGEAFTALCPPFGSTKR